eukprot:3096610-Pleurochrysis_carterae.AAC.1
MSPVHSSYIYPLRRPGYARAPASRRRCASTTTQVPWRGAAPRRRARISARYLSHHLGYL